MPIAREIERHERPVDALGRRLVEIEFHPGPLDQGDGAVAAGEE